LNVKLKNGEKSSQGRGIFREGRGKLKKVWMKKAIEEKKGGRKWKALLGAGLQGEMEKNTDVWGSEKKMNGRVDAEEKGGEKAK